MINICLRKFVENNPRVIIPNIGAFLRKNGANASFEAPIIFSPFLRFNDGLLENLVAAEGHTTKEEAAEKVREFVQDVLKIIAGKQPFYVDRLGIFYQDERGAVQFVYAETESDGSRKFAEIVAKFEGRSVLSLEEEKKENVSPATEAATPPATEAATEEPQVKNAVADKPVSTPDSKQADDAQVVGEEKARQLDAASNSLQRWMEKRKSDTAKLAEKVTPPEEERTTEKRTTEKKEEKTDSAYTAPDVQEEAAQATSEKSHYKQQPQPQQKPQQVKATHEQVSQEAKRFRQEAIERALAEKTRKAREKLEAEEAQKKLHEAALLSEKSSATLTPKTWEENVMEKRQSSHYGMWIFLFAMLFTFVAGAVAILQWDSISNFFSKADTANVEYSTSAPILPPAQAENPRIPAAAPTPAPTPQPEVYYIAVGVFNLEDNARAVAKKLYETKKLKSEVVRTSDGKFAVSVSKYGSRSAALKDAGRYKKQHGNVRVVAAY
ncbi:MAG: SPOR domain-containing protein [Prevotellaceae bacterium]|jgi:chemotaxis protein histidine kinase CheA|nr:SPOR domain-containing protein [Prevotellaceae bacterium]